MEKPVLPTFIVFPLANVAAPVLVLLANLIPVPVVVLPVLFTRMFPLNAFPEVDEAIEIMEDPVLVNVTSALKVSAVTVADSNQPLPEFTKVVTPLNTFPPNPLSVVDPVFVNVVVPLNVLRLLLVPLSNRVAALMVTVPLKVEPPPKVSVPAVPLMLAETIVPLKVAELVVVNVRDAEAPVLLMVPVVKVRAVVEVMVKAFPFRSIVPVYPLTVILLMVGAISRLQLPRPLPLKITALALPGTDAPPAPPEVVDQLAVLFQFDAEVAIQYRLWHSEVLIQKINKTRPKKQKFLIANPTIKSFQGQKIFNLFMYKMNRQSGRLFGLACFPS